MIFGLLGLANLAQDDVIQFHPFTWWSASPKHIRSWHLVAWEPSWFLHLM
jgi:hypothetical protein